MSEFNHILVAFLVVVGAAGGYHLGIGDTGRKIRSTLSTELSCAKVTEVGKKKLFTPTLET